jgi:hypothetical protein
MDAADTTPSIIDLSSPLLGSSVAGSIATQDFKSPEDIQKYVQSITAAQIRASLEAAGVPQDKLDAITDEQMKMLFEQTLTDANASGELSQLVSKAQATEPTP